MIEKVSKIVNHRDFVLSLAIVSGLIFGKGTEFLSDISIYALAVVMIAATSRFTFKSWIPLKNALIPIGISVLLNYVLFGLIVIGVSKLFFPGEENLLLWTGFVLIAAAPPGPSIIPFSTMLKGDINFSVSGVFGLHIVAMVLAPAIVLIFLGKSMINPMEIFMILVKLIVIPLIISRFLRHPKIVPTTNKIRPFVVKWGFFIVITPIVGMSRNVIFDNPNILILTSLVFIISMFALAFVYGKILKANKTNVPRIISSTLMMVIKSSAFSAVVAMTFFDDEVVAMPSAVLSVFVTLFIIFYSMYARKVFGV
ncbi:MAG: bile acid:sodium symporter family protein [Bacteroidales bacterium]